MDPGDEGRRTFTRNVPALQTGNRRMYRAGLSMPTSFRRSRWTISAKRYARTPSVSSVPGSRKLISASRWPTRPMSGVGGTGFGYFTGPEGTRTRTGPCPKYVAVNDILGPKDQSLRRWLPQPPGSNKDEAMANVPARKSRLVWPVLFMSSSFVVGR
ncbi:MAG: hypothetical protein ACYTDW_00595 [Planctomycetota bacterium]